MDKKNKKEMLQVIEEQKQKLALRETKLRDVISAFKSLQAEKAALEAGLKAASKNINTDNQTLSGSDDNISSLTAALSTIAAEKSRMEIAFQLDKKKFLKEKEELDNTNIQLREQLAEAKRNYESRLEETVRNLAVEQHERDKERSTHGLMLRELQQMLSEERRRREQIELKFQEASVKPYNKDGDDEQTELQLRHKVEELQRRLGHAENKAKEPENMLKLLQKEMKQMKAHHISTLQEEQHRVDVANERARQLSASHEERVAALEGRLAELSEMVGKYDRMRQQDLLAIQNLEDQLSKPQMADLPIRNIYKFDDKQVSDQDVHTLAEQIVHLVKLLHDSNEMSEKTIDVEAFLAKHNLSTNHETCKMQYNKLQHDYDRLLQQNSAPRNIRNFQDNEIESLQSECMVLKDQLRLTLAQLDNIHADHKKEIDQYQKNIVIQYNQKLALGETEHVSKVLQLEEQLKLQRERTMALLEEKDEELCRLRAELTATALTSATSKYLDTDDILLPVHTHLDGEARMLHYVHELARRDVEIAALRKAKHSLETDCRQNVQELAARDDSHAEEIRTLKSEVDRLRRNASREGANLEYLKNVVLRYMLSSDSNSRQHILNAISAVLHFSPQELESVKQHNDTRWWRQTSASRKLSFS